MIQDISLRIEPERAASRQTLARAVAKVASIPVERINDLRVIRRSVDARKQKVMLNLNVRIATGEDTEVAPLLRPVDYTPVSQDAPVIVIVGAGPPASLRPLRPSDSA